MEPNLTAHYLAHTIDSARRSRRAERGWLIEQAAMQQGHRKPARVRRWIGGLMIAAGQRMQGVPEPTIRAITPAQTR